MITFKERVEYVRQEYQRRKYAGYLTDLSKKSGILVPNLHTFFNGKEGCYPYTLEKIEKAMGIDYETKLKSE